MYCIYLTIYSGNKLPPFYIGSTSISKIDEGYCGSVESKKYGDIFRSELKNNRHLFKVRIVEFCSDRKQALEREEWYHRKLNVVASEMYMNCAYATTGCFGIPRPGNDNPFYGRKHSDETKAKVGKSSKERMTSEQARMMRSNRKIYLQHTDESKKKMSTIHQNMKPVPCPYCDKIGKYSIMKRWHFDKCKFIAEKE
jgi:hypothetical protein